MTFKPTRMETAGLLVVAVQLSLAAFTARYGSTGPVPVHFSGAGVIDRWGDRTEAAWMIATLAALTLFIVGAIAVSLRTNPPSDARRKGLTLSQGLVLFVLGGLTVLPVTLASPGFNPALGGKLAASTICLVLAVTGAVLGKVPPNALVGVRTPWSLSSRLAWDRSNRLAGRLFFWGGILALPLIPFAPPQIGVSTVTTGVLLIALVVIFESWRVWRTDPDRRAV